MKVREFLKKIQNKPENVRKKILWAIIIIIGLLLSVFWIIKVKKSINEFQKENFIKNFNFEDLNEQIKNLPPVEIPKIDEEELKKIDEEIKKEEEKEIQNQSNK